jgi:hypothetical protein
MSLYIYCIKSYELSETVDAFITIFAYLTIFLPC